MAPYIKSKTVAERAAWAFINSDANSSKMELAVIIPLVVVGPSSGRTSRLLFYSSRSSRTAACLLVPT
jgi:hypothetical protein